MTFSEELKLEVKKKAMFQCCRCRAISVEVHHIVPQHEHGEDTIDNAAPLCPNCHSWFGDNPLKKKEIRQMRDNWYEVVERMYSGQASALIPLVEKISQGLEEVKKIQSTDVTEIKTMLKEVSNKAIDSMTLGTANLTASNVVLASGATLSNIDISKPATVLGGSPGFLPKSTQCVDCGKDRDNETYYCNECRVRRGMQ